MNLKSWYKVDNNINGIIIVDKPRGFTSHDVVNVIRKIYGTRKVGHTGTLDPDATGVFPVCLGKATKVCDMLTFSDKEYVARVRLGVVTDTQDMSGTVLETSEVNVNEEELLSAVSEFIGEIEQIPPMYSALKVGGQKLCDLARKGIEVERKPRKITIYEAEVSNFDGVEFSVRVFCSKGTYIRTLCHDIGQRLGCGAAMSELRRTKSSVFSLENAHTLDELKTLAEKNEHLSLLAPVDSVFDYPKLTISDAVKKRVCNGATGYINAEPGLYRTYDAEGVFLCISKVIESGDGDKNLIKLEKAFY
ncbi:MAG: tRNA pseudouridine(55) synthase TruB [Clostridia bacterium]|nr:tRNA pseudouridine(55) synthase TruB [Clostridia bacterium]